jgi:DNA polymerase-1
MIEINRELRKRNMKSRIVGQIHDCMLADIHKSEIQVFLDLLKDIMTVRLPKAWPWLIVPLETEVDVVPDNGSWNEKQPWSDKTGKWAPL